MLVALAIVMAGGVTMLVISQASAGEVAGAFVPGALSEGAIGFAALGSVLQAPVTGYGFVYLIELALLLATLVVIGPLARRRARPPPAGATRFGLAEFPG